MYAVQGRKRDAPAGAHKVQLRRACLAIIERDHDNARDERKRRMDEELFRRGEQLCLYTMGRRAEREECFCKQQNKFLPMVHRCVEYRSGHQLDKSPPDHTQQRTSTAVLRLRRRALLFPRHGRNHDFLFQRRYRRERRL